MEFHAIALAVLLVAAVTDLTVGVANDAVNFLNSAVGSCAATRRTILIVASLGVLVGTTFSSGIMEVARSGIFNPQYFVMHEVMIIFVAVMLTDIILLDVYNTFGLPTSTTVSIVFGILGGATAVAVLKVLGQGGTFEQVLAHINTANTLVIISGIGLSIAFAFVFGLSIQFLTRVLFTFDYQPAFRRFGSLYCGAALAAMTYFILIKGAKGSSLIPQATTNWLLSHPGVTVATSFVFWALLWQLVISLTRVNVLKVVVLIGTFSLALAFAANDLVNFIGAPLGAMKAYQIAVASGETDPGAVTMQALGEPVRANTLLLLLAGAIMVLTLWVSRKARGVTDTEVKLGRQDDGVERFASSALSRGLVRMGIAFFEAVKAVTPARVQRAVSERIDPSRYLTATSIAAERPSFDLLRATVNLMVASALISLGTSLKLPLSTTFVTFAVAMSTALGDGAWGRESAVYRVNGVITVIGGWFVTGLMAFSVAFAFAALIYWGESTAVFALVGLGGVLFYRTMRYHRWREAERQARSRAALVEASSRSGIPWNEIRSFVASVAPVAEAAFIGLAENRRRALKKAHRRAKELMKECDRMTSHILRAAASGSGEETGYESVFTGAITAVPLIATNLRSLAKDSYYHLNNNHSAPDKVQAENFKKVGKMVGRILNDSAERLQTYDPDAPSALSDTYENLRSFVLQCHLELMKRVRSGKSGARTSLLFFSNLSHAQRMTDHSVQLVKLLEKLEIGRSGGANVVPWRNEPAAAPSQGFLYRARERDRGLREALTEDTYPIFV
jgi:phosphate/sulfate permease